MKRQDKIFEVKNLEAKVKESKSVALVDYRGMTVAQATELRRKIREAIPGPSPRRGEGPGIARSAGPDHAPARDRVTA